MTTFCSCVVVFPFSSLYVQVTSVVSVIGNVALCVPVIIPVQLSVAVGAVKLVTSHSAVTSESIAISATGAITSLMTTFCSCVAVFPFPSSYVQVTSVVAVIGNVALCAPVISPSQLSVAVGAVKLVTSHSAVTSGNVEISATGAVTSSTLTVIVV